MQPKGRDVKETREFYKNILNEEDRQYLKETQESLRALRKWLKDTIIGKGKETIESAWDEYPFQFKPIPSNVNTCLERTTLRKQAEDLLGIFNSKPIMGLHYTNNPQKLFTDISIVETALGDLTFNLKMPTIKELPEHIKPENQPGMQELDSGEEETDQTINS